MFTLTVNIFIVLKFLTVNITTILVKIKTQGIFFKVQN